MPQQQSQLPDFLPAGQSPQAAPQKLPDFIPAGGGPPVDPRQVMPDLARQYGLDPELMNRLIQQESSWNPRAVSPKGAQGLMQLMGPVQQRYGIKDPFDPLANMRGGMQEFARLQKLYGGDYNRALAAYNAGEGAVASGSYSQETQDYLSKITQGYKAPLPDFIPVQQPQQQQPRAVGRYGEDPNAPYPEAITRGLVAASKGLSALRAPAEWYGKQMGDVFRIMFSEEGPAAPIPSPQGTPGTGFPSHIAGATGEVLGQTIADPTNWPFFASGVARPALQKFISYAFAAQMGHGTIKAAQYLHDNWDNMTPEQRAEYITSTGLQAAMAGAATYHTGTLTGGAAPVRTDIRVQAPTTGGTAYQPPAGGPAIAPTHADIATEGALKPTVEPASQMGAGAAGLKGASPTPVQERIRVARALFQRPQTPLPDFIPVEQPKPSTVYTGPERRVAPGTPPDVERRISGGPPQVLEGYMQMQAKTQPGSPEHAQLQRMIDDITGGAATRPRPQVQPVEPVRPSEAPAAGASQEAINRMRAEKLQGTRIESTNTLSGQVRPLIGPEAHAGDIKPGPYDRIERVKADGSRELIAEGSKARPFVPRMQKAEADVRAFPERTKGQEPRDFDELIKRQVAERKITREEAARILARRAGQVAEPGKGFRFSGLSPEQQAILMKEPYVPTQPTETAPTPAPAAATGPRPEPVRGPEAPARSAGEPISKPTEVVESPFDKLASAQRGDPESRMLDIQHSHIASGVYSNIIEHVGDITHRMSEMSDKLEGGYEFVKPKVERAIIALESKYGFQREMEENIRNNVGQLKLNELEARSRLKQMGEAYAKAHEALPVFNETQKIARDAAVKLGRMDFEGAKVDLKKLKEVLDKGPDAWKAAALTSAKTTEVTPTTPIPAAGKAPERPTAPAAPPTTLTLEKTVRGLPNANKEIIDNLKATAQRESAGDSAKFEQKWREALTDYGRKLMRNRPKVPPEQAGFFGQGRPTRPKTEGQKKAAKEAKEAHAALDRGSLRTGLGQLTDATSKLPEGKLDDRIAAAKAAIKTPGAAKLSPLRSKLANVATNIGILKDWYMKGAKTGLKIGDALKGNTDPKTAFKRIMGTWERTNQEADFDLYNWVKEIQSTHKPEIRDAITVYRDTGGDLKLLADKANDPKVPEKLRLAAKLASQFGQPEFKEALQTAKDIGAYTDAIGKELMSLGALNHMVENYMPHLYEADHSYAKGIVAEMNAGVFDTRFKYAMKRIFGNYFEAAEKGKVPKNLGVDFLTSAYDRTARQAISARAAIKEMYGNDAADNRPLLAPSWDSIKPILPSEYESHPQIKQLLEAHPKLKGELAEGYTLRARGGPRGQVLPVATLKALGIPFDENMALLGEKARMSMEDYEAVPHWAFKKHIFAGEGPDGKPLFYQAELWAHPSIVKDLKALYEQSQFRQHPITRVALKATSTSKKILLSWLPSGFHYTQEGWHAVGHVVNPFSRDIWSGKSVEQSIKGSSPDAKLVQEGMKNGLMVFDFNAAEKFGEGIAGSRLAMKEHLFQKFVPGLKTELYPKQFRKNLKTYGAQGWSEAEVHQLTARQVNDAFGMQDEVFSGRSKFMQDLFRLVALAPDFLESRARFLGQALRPGGKEQRLALLRQGMYMYGAARLLNAWTNDGDAKWNPGDAFTWHVRGKTFSIRSILTDAMFAATDIGGFIASRGALLPRAFAESYHEMKKPKWEKEKYKGSAVDAMIRGQAPIMTQGLLSGLFRKYVQGREKENIAWDTFRSVVEGLFGIRAGEEQVEKRGGIRPIRPSRPRR